MPQENMAAQSIRPKSTAVDSAITKRKQKKKEKKQQKSTTPSSAPYQKADIYMKD